MPAFIGYLLKSIAVGAVSKPENFLKYLIIGVIIIFCCMSLLAIPFAALTSVPLMLFDDNDPMKHTYSLVASEMSKTYSIDLKPELLIAIHSAMYDQDLSNVSRSDIENLVNRFVIQTGVKKETKVKTETINTATTIGIKTTSYEVETPVYGIKDYNLVLDDLVRENLLSDKDTAIEYLNSSMEISNDSSFVQYHGDSNLSNTNISAPVYAKLTNSQGNRSTGAYESVISQFDVQNNPRYLKRDGYTYCNVFALDLLRAMGVGLPDYMLAETIFYWMENVGSSYGWYNVSSVEATNRANKGFPTIVVMPIPPKGSNGHICVVSPTRIGDSGVYVAQAGGHNYNYAPISAVFSEGAYIKYYTHD